MQRAHPEEAALSTTRTEEQQYRLRHKQPGGNTRAGTGTPAMDTSLTEMHPLHEDWEWHMQSREGQIRFRTGPDDPRVA
jgi:hypothetical protein